MLKWLGGGDARERRPRRVAVIDAAAVDRRRSVVLIRRDNIEHLVMIGGPNDVVIESNIIRANVARGPAWPAAPGPTRFSAELSNRLTPPEVPPPPARSKAERAAPPRRGASVHGRWRHQRSRPRRHRPLTIWRS
jgi:flagellar protein FliO/FliZ